MEIMEDACGSPSLPAGEKSLWEFILQKDEIEQIWDWYQATNFPSYSWNCLYLSLYRFL